MIFATIGIVILVISFVIALITLVREQSATDKTGVVEPEGNKDTVVPVVEGEKVDSLTSHKGEEMSPYQMPQDAVVASMASADTIKGADADQQATALPETTAQKPHVWWEQLGQDADEPDATNEDQESIEKIRAELAKLMATKTNISQEEGLAVEKRQNKTQIGSLAAETLAGEFSLREIKKKD